MASEKNEVPTIPYPINDVPETDTETSTPESCFSQDSINDNPEINERMLSGEEEDEEGIETCIHDDNNGFKVVNDDADSLPLGDMVCKENHRWWWWWLWMTKMKWWLCVSACILLALAIALSVVFVGSNDNNINKSNDSNSINNELADNSMTEEPTTINILQTEEPTISSPAQLPTLTPSFLRTVTPSFLTTNFPIIAPTKMPQSTPNPTTKPTPLPTPNPTAPPTPVPTRMPTPNPTNVPTWHPTNVPTRLPTRLPTSSPTVATTEPPKISNFYVIGDLPYPDEEKAVLLDRIREIPSDADFVVHIGDIRKAETLDQCELKDYEDIKDILLESPVPVFIVPGDNEYNDCANPEEALGFFRSTFVDMENNWNLPFKVKRNDIYPESFYFTHKSVLYIGLNIVGGRVHNRDSWTVRLDYQFQWIKGLIEKLILDEDQKIAASVVIFGHAAPREEHGAFFWPLEGFYKNDVNEMIPMKYVHGDLHYFEYEKSWFGNNFPRIMTAGRQYEPPLQITVTIPADITNIDLEANEIFFYDRHL